MPFNEYFGSLKRAWSEMPLSTQLLIVLIACNAPIFIAYHIYDTRYTRNEVLSLERDTLDTVTPLLKNAIEHAMVDGQADHIESVLKAITRGGAVGHAQLLDHERKVVKSAHLPMTRGPRKTKAVLSFAGGWVTSEHPLELKPACVRCHGDKKPIIGYIRLTSPVDRATRVIRRLYAARAAMIFGGLVFLLISVMIIVRRMVHAPMRRLTEAMKSVTEGKLDIRMEVPNASELRFIAEGFNSMVGELQRDRREITALHRRQVGHVDRLVTLGELSSHLAHEVRNPLTGISSAIQVMLTDLPPKSPKRDVLSKILGQLNRMDRTMGSFLGYTRMPEAAIRPFRIDDPLKRTLAILEPRLRSQRIELVQKFADDLPTIQGDLGQMEQVFLNLCLNAAQAMPEGGTLTIRAQREGAEQVLVEFRDTGRGVPPEDLSKIFNPFFTTRKDGSGLGLPICKQIITGHNGDISIESIPGKGTSVFIRLPVDPQNDGSGNA